jgi:hypothetical protein
MGCKCKEKKLPGTNPNKSPINKERLEEVRQRIIKLTKEGKRNKKG